MSPVWELLQAGVLPVAWAGDGDHTLMRIDELPRLVG